MSFSFGFSGDDVDDEMNDGSGDVVQDQTAANGSAQKQKVEGLPAREHSLDELVCLISFLTVIFSFWFDLLHSWLFGRRLYGVFSCGL